MNEELFTSILTKAFEREYAPLAAGNEHRFSLRHRRGMEKILRRTESAVAADTSLRARPTLRRRLIIALIVAFTAVILTVTVVALVINGFKVTEKSDHTEFLAIGSENAPTTIVEIYEPSWIPDGFEQTLFECGRQTARSKYEFDNKYIFFFQYSLPAFQGISDSEHCNQESIIINSFNGIIWRDEQEIYIYWNNGDYIFAIYGNIPKEDLIKLANSTKISNS